MPKTFREAAGAALALAGIIAATRIKNRRLALCVGLVSLAVGADVGKEPGTKPR